MVMPGGGETGGAADRRPQRQRGRSRDRQKDWGFDDPVYVQYADMMKKVFTGDLISYANQQST